MPELTKEQLEVINHGSGNILVSASAGSGKTHTMIERIKRLIINEGVGVNEILAVTFTETAAADMKDKLRKALTDALNGKFDGNLSGKQKRACQKQLTEIATADICTMHAFCGRLIRAYFFTVGLSPDFKILDEADSNVLRVESIEKTFKEFYESGEQWFLTLVDRHAFGRLDNNLKELVLKVYSFCDSEANPFGLADKYQTIYTEQGFESLLLEYKNLFIQRLEPLKRDAFEAFKVFTSEGLSKACEFTNTLINDMYAAMNCEDIYALKKYQNYKLRLDFERKLSESALEYKKVISDVRDKFVKIINRFVKCVGDSREEDFKRFSVCREHTENFVKLIKRFFEIYSQEKREENALDFNDLEHFALKILSDEQVADAVRKKYKYIFIDEYQDTNGVQEDIVSKIGSDNVFMVGDVKQSIYGFRGCRSEFFTEKDKSMTERGEKVVRLNHNFRSATSVLQTVNGIFNYCMTDGVYGENYKEKAQLVSGGIYPEEYRGRTQLHYLKREDRAKRQAEESRIYDILKENPQEENNEVKTLSALIANIITEERGKKFYDPKKGEYRQVGYGDITVLTRNRNSKYVNDLVSGLIQNGIPVSSDVKENVCDFPEIKIMINALKLVDCFLQDLPLVSTLKSPIGGFSEEELFEIVRFYDDNAKNNHGSFSGAYSFYLENAKTTLTKRLIAFGEYFNKIRLVSDFVGAHGVLTKLISDSKLQAYLYAKPLGADMVDRLLRFVSASVVNGKTLTVREFLLRVNTCPEAFGLSPFASENTVKVMTIHASKGLEFPVVITCGLERAFNEEDDYGEIMLSRNRGFAVMHYDDNRRVKSETLLRGVIREEKRNERIREEMRLFYVATTRATYSLHMTFWTKDDVRRKEFVGADKFLDFIPGSIAAIEHESADLEFKRNKREIKDVIILKPDQNAVKKMKTDFSFSYPYKADCTLPLKASVTSVAKTELDPDLPVVYTLFDDAPDAESGTVAHKILENFDFNSDKMLDRQAKDMVINQVLTERELGLVNLDRLTKALDNDAFSRIKGKSLFREKAFLVNIGADKVFDTDSREPVLIQGVIDLLVIDGDSAEIIDYKYSSLDNERLKAKYKKQLDLYAYAVEKVLKKKVLKKTLVNIFSGDGVEIE